MKKTFILFGILSFFVGIQVMAQVTERPVRLREKPVLSEVTETSARVTIPRSEALSSEERAGVYFEYIEKGKMCIMIYPTPAECLPGKTKKGLDTVVIQNLKPNTTYLVNYKKDNTIQCITTPCLDNGWSSDQAEFTTLGNTVSLTQNLWYRRNNSQVKVLQELLKQKGYYDGEITGYFGIATFKAVKNFQKNYMHIPPTGFVGEKTRAALNSKEIVTEEYFEGVVDSFSTACFSDGECSITVGGKKVITTIGWSQETVGSIKGVPSIGDTGTKLGHIAKVFAKKTSDGYTLYGSTNYYIEIQ